MQHPEEGIIHAWLDGELPAEEAAALEAHVSACADCSAKVAEARGLIAASSRIVSALDIVPGGVIPSARAVSRPWYASTQFRAAAAVLIVAGASALVMRNGGRGAMEDSVRLSAPAEAPASAPLTTTRAVQDSPERALPLSSARGKDIKAAPAPRTRDEGRIQKEIAQAPAPAAPPPVVESQAASVTERDVLRARTATANDAAAARRKAADSSRGFSTPAMSDVVVTGVATSAGAVAAPSPAPELKKLRTDSTAAGIETEYELSSGVRVVLTDIQRVERRLEKAAANTPAAPPMAQSKAEVFTLSWTDKRGHHMTLRGAVPLAVLEQIRRSLPEDRR